MMAGRRCALSCGRAVVWVASATLSVSLLYLGVRSTHIGAHIAPKPIHSIAVAARRGP